MLSPSPSAKRISVTLGATEVIRCGGLGMVTWRPSASRTVRGNAAAARAACGMGNARARTRATRPTRGAPAGREREFIISRSIRPGMNRITVADFERVEMRVGRIVQVEDFPKARKPSYRLLIDFGPYGTRRSAAAVRPFYTREELLGRQVVAVTDFPPPRLGASPMLRVKCWCWARSSTGGGSSCCARTPRPNWGRGSHDPAAPSPEMPMRRRGRLDPTGAQQQDDEGA